MALNVAVVAPAARVTDAGTASSVLLLASVTEVPPAGAGCVIVTVQVLVALCPRLAGLQATPDTSAGACRVIVAVWELAPSVAVTVALWLLSIEAAAVAVNVPVVTDAGTVSSALLLARVTEAPPAGASCVSVTVQVLVPLCPRLDGLQARPDTSTGPCRLIVAVWELVPSVAVTVAL